MKVHCGTIPIKKKDKNYRLGTVDECFTKISLYGLKQVPREQYDQMRVDKRVNELKQRLQKIKDEIRENRDEQKKLENRKNFFENHTDAWEEIQKTIERLKKLKENQEYKIYQFQTDFRQAYLHDLDLQKLEKLEKNKSKKKQSQKSEKKQSRKSEKKQNQKSEKKQNATEYPFYKFFDNDAKDILKLIYKYKLTKPSEAVPKSEDARMVKFEKYLDALNGEIKLAIKESSDENAKNDLRFIKKNAFEIIGSLNAITDEQIDAVSGKEKNVKMQKNIKTQNSGKKQRQWYYDYLSDKEKEAYDFTAKNGLKMPSVPQVFRNDEKKREYDIYDAVQKLEDVAEKLTQIKKEQFPQKPENEQKLEQFKQFTKTIKTLQNSLSLTIIDVFEKYVL